jgi:hypothetical protein
VQSLAPQSYKIKSRASTWGIPKFLFSTEAKKNSSDLSFDPSEVSFDSSEEFFLTSVENFNFPASYLEFPTWKTSASRTEASLSLSFPENG